MRKYLRVLVFLLLFAQGIPVHAKEIIFADVGWDSIKLNNALAGLVAEKAYGYTWKEIPGSTPIIHEALLKGEVDVAMEEWSNNIASYSKDLEDGRFTELGVNFDDNHQGFYIPRYVADANPGLKNVRDLADYPSLFPDTEEEGKAIIYGGIPGWAITNIMEKKVEAYGLTPTYNYVVPGSNASLDSTITRALDRKENIVTYYWEPTWLMGKYDFVLLEDSPFDELTFKDGIGSCPSVKVTIACSNAFLKENAEFCTFLSRYHLSSSLISDALAFMEANDATHGEGARWLLETHPELLDEWLPEEKAEKMHDWINQGEETGVSKTMFDFPFSFSIHPEEIDGAVRNFASTNERGLTRIQKGLGGLVNGFAWILSHLPWFVLLALVFFAGWKTRNLKSGLLYAVLVSCIGLLGLWDEMLVTFAIVLASVFLALALGLPIGILLSYSKKANEVARPILDTMQTMPVFVYLIPALLLFGMGNASAVIATVIYAIVPVIRLTSLGLRQVDGEVVEAAVSFGSTKWQALWKVQIPQALPTIMSGVNQTLMMAMSMVVTCSMIGARGLGMEVLNAVNRIEIGRGIIAGSSVVILAVVLDRITQGEMGKHGGKHGIERDE